MNLETRYHLDQNLINEIGISLDLNMANQRDLTEILWEDSEGYVKGSVKIYNNIPMLIFIDAKYGTSYYTLNLLTLKPTKASYRQTPLNNDMRDKIIKNIAPVCSVPPKKICIPQYFYKCK